VIDVPFLLHKRSKNPHLNCSTRKQLINKLEIDSNRYILKLLDEPKSARSDPDFVKQLIYLMHLLHKASKTRN